MQPQSARQTGKTSFNVILRMARKSQQTLHRKIEKIEKIEIFEYSKPPSKLMSRATAPT